VTVVILGLYTLTRGRSLRAQKPK